jgi:hypothetical protein
MLAARQAARRSDVPRASRTLRTLRVKVVCLQQRKPRLAPTPGRPRAK